MFFFKFFFEKYLKKTTLTNTSLELVKDKLEKKGGKANQSIMLQ